MRQAVFLDRDGTLIEHVHYLADPAQVRLLPGAADAIRILQSLDYACVVVTNQSAVGRGHLSLETLAQIHDEMHRQLRAWGVRLDGLYFCPHVPQTADRAQVEHPDRKPGPGMLRQASRDMLLDLSRSWMVGDLLSDMLAGRNAGCRGTVLVRTGQGVTVPPNHPAVDFETDDILDAARMIARRHAPAPLVPKLGA